jgi:hypothetical protein
VCSTAADVMSDWNGRQVIEVGLPTGGSEDCSFASVPGPEVPSGMTDIPAAAKRVCRSATWPAAAGYLSVLVGPDEIKLLVGGEDHGGLTARQAADALSGWPVLLDCIGYRRSLRLGDVL